LNALVEFALRQRVLVVILLVLVLAGGIASFNVLNIEAYPDPVPPLVDIVTQSGGQSAEEIERYITIPIEVQMAGIPNVQAIRSISLFGLSTSRSSSPTTSPTSRPNSGSSIGCRSSRACQTARNRRSPRPADR